jgi:serralysin
MEADPALRPVRIAAAAMGNRRVVRLSRQHGVVIVGRQGPRLVRAGMLAGNLPGVTVASPRRGLRFHHFMLDRHAVVFADGLPCETFYPGRWALRGLGADDLSRLVAQFPRIAAVLAGAAPQAVYGPTLCAVASAREVHALIAASSARRAAWGDPGPSHAVVARKPRRLSPKGDFPRPRQVGM